MYESSESALHPEIGALYLAYDPCVYPQKRQEEKKIDGMDIRGMVHMQ